MRNISTVKIAYDLKQLSHNRNKNVFKLRQRDHLALLLMLRRERLDKLCRQCGIFICHSLILLEKSLQAQFVQVCLNDALLSVEILILLIHRRKWLIDRSLPARGATTKRSLAKDHFRAGVVASRSLRAALPANNLAAGRSFRLAE